MCTCILHQINLSEHNNCANFLNISQAAVFLQLSQVMFVYMTIVKSRVVIVGNLIEEYVRVISTSSGRIDQKLSKMLSFARLKQVRTFHER